MSKFGYKKLFDDQEAEPYFPKDEDIDELAYCMSGASRFPKKGKIHLDKDSLSGIPAGYTYLGQFIAHDISFDSNSDREEISHHPWKTKVHPSNIENLHTPFFDLESLYGSSIGETPHKEMLEPNSNTLLRLGYTDNSEDSSIGSFPNDLPRKDGSLIAEIVDKRNDENLLLAQTQVSFMKFHNAIVRELFSGGEADSFVTFEKARRIVIRYYQRIVLDDFLTRIVPAKVLEKVKSDIRKLPDQTNATDMQIPFEFTGAAFRFGHSMIRGSYNLNRIQKGNDASLDLLMKFTGSGGMDSSPLNKRLQLPTSWIINWYLFYDFKEKQPRSDFNLAGKINTELTQMLQMLMPTAPIDQQNNSEEPIKYFKVRGDSLSALDLFRGRALNLMSGQEIAHRLGSPVIDTDQMSKLLITKKIDKEPQSAEIMKKLQAVFSDKTPLWFYILAEAEIQTGGTKLGEVGGRIVAEVIYKLIKCSPISVLQTEWNAKEDWLLEDGKFGMPQMLRFIRETNPDKDKYDELNPLD